MAIIASCGSDNLSNSEAENLISDCLEIAPLQQSAYVKINTAQFTKEENQEIAKYENLRDEGYLEMALIKKEVKKSTKSNDPLEQWRIEAENRRQSRYTEYTIRLTEKSIEFILEASENSNRVLVKTFKYEVDEVLEVQELPAMNTAKVKAKFVAEDVTPFSILSRKDPSEFLVEDVQMNKTSNGWKYCDNF